MRALALVLLVGCGASAPRVSRASELCGAETGLLLEAPASIPARWRGGAIVAGDEPVMVRWCGMGHVTLDRVRVLLGGQPIQSLSFDDVRIAPGQAFPVEVTGTPAPAALAIEAVVLDDEHRTFVATATVEATPEPTSEPAACARAGGTYGAVGRAGMPACDRPTSDAGARCLSSAECEGTCLADHTEVVAAAADGRICEPREETHLHVGMCATTTLLFGCAPRLVDRLTECVAPGASASTPTVCVD